MQRNTVLYRLSNGQQKEAAARAVQVAIPIDEEDCGEEVGEMLAYVRARLDVPPSWVRRVRQEEILTDFARRGGPALTGVLGPILSKRARTSNWVIRIPAIVAEIQINTHTRRPPKPTAWPAALTDLMGREHG